MVYGLENSSILANGWASNAVVSNVITVQSITHLLVAEQIEFPTHDPESLHPPKPQTKSKKTPFFFPVSPGLFILFYQKPLINHWFCRIYPSTWFNPRYKTSSFTFRRSPATEISAPVIFGSWRMVFRGDKPEKACNTGHRSESHSINKNRSL